MHTTSIDGELNMDNDKIIKRSTVENKEIPVRCQDLATRERVNFVVNSIIMGKLREYSKNVKLPMSRIIDTALTAYLNCHVDMSSPNSSGKLNNIILHHLLEIIIYESIDSVHCTRLFSKISEHFLRYIYTSCVLNLNTPEETLIGTKIFLFISDEESDDMAKLFEYISDAQKHVKIEVNLDHKAV